MKLRQFVLLGVSVLGVSLASQSFAQRVSKITAGQLEKMCQNQSGLKMCDAYISGVMDGSIWQQLYNKHDKEPMDPAFCVPGNQTIAQVRATLNTWIKAHPEKANQAAGRIIFDTLHATYACKAPSK